jgi:hypothetical protein
MSIKKYKSGKLAEPFIRGAAKIGYMAKYQTLLSEINLISSSLENFYPEIDKYISREYRDKQVLDLALELTQLPQEELALELAKSQIILKLHLPFYHQVMTQLTFFQNKYQQEIDKNHQSMDIRVSRKKEADPTTAQFNIAEKILRSQHPNYDYLAFCRKLKSVIKKDIPSSTSRNYFFKLTGLKSTKKVT